MKKHALLPALTALALLIGSAGTAHAQIIPHYGPGQIGYHGAVLCEELTLRQEPNASSKAVKTIKYGDFLGVFQVVDGWAECYFSDDVNGGPEGWVNADYIVVDPDWYKTDEQTPVYAWNETTALRVALLDKDVTLPILKDEGDWLIVSLRGATGWIHKTAADKS